MTLVLIVIAVWLMAWWLNTKLAAKPKSRLISFLVPAIFGLTLLILWEGIVRGLEVRAVLLPPPSAIVVAFYTKMPILWVDFVQT